MSEIVTINTIAEAHTFMGQPAPKHPLVSIIALKDMPVIDFGDVRFASKLYMISLKDGVVGSIGYGRNSYDFTNGTMIFGKPNQVYQSESKEISADSKGWTLLFHPDLIRKSELVKTIDSYNFFSYEVHEALHLSEDEKETVTDTANKIRTEYQQPIDAHSQRLIVSNIQLLLDYCQRYYDRQFYVRTNMNQDLITRFEQFLKDYYSSEKPQELGIPSVRYCGEQMNMSPNYLSDLLRKETGRSAGDHIHEYIIDKAKNRLLASTDSIGQIAYDLGFEYPQHFSKVFKKQTGMSPLKYRSLN